ncbi:MAG: hypothetical protein ACKPKO_13300, partial [Candidatus Fonsibacter sp.]
MMPKTESTVGNDNCVKWTTEASTDKAPGSVRRVPNIKFSSVASASFWLETVQSQSLTKPPYCDESLVVEMRLHVLVIVMRFKMNLPNGL